MSALTCLVIAIGVALAAALIFHGINAYVRKHGNSMLWRWFN